MDLQNSTMLLANVYEIGKEAPVREVVLDMDDSSEFLRSLERNEYAVFKPVALFKMDI